MTLSIMKRLITIILILALTLPAAAVAEEQDQIVGTWYMYCNVPGSPMESSYPDLDSSLILFTFEKSGNVFYIELDYKGTIVTPNDRVIAGKWEKDGSNYKVSIIAGGVSDAFIKDGMLHAAVFNSELYMVLRKLEPFDFYNEMYRK